MDTQVGPAPLTGDSVLVTDLISAAVGAALRGVGAAAAAEHSCDVELLEGYLPALLQAAVARRRLTDAEAAACSAGGGRAAQAGLSLPALVDLYMTASRRLWPQLPDLVAAQRGRPFAPTELLAVGEVVWRAADDALAALAAGYLDVQRLVVRQEESHRLQFFADLLGGHADLGTLVERGQAYGLALAAEHVVAVLQPEQPLSAEGRVTEWVQRTAQQLLGSSRSVTVTAADGRLVYLLSSGPASSASGPGGSEQLLAELTELARPAAAELASPGRWRMAVSQPHPGPLGISRGYREALGALETAEQLQLPQPVVLARQLLVYRVLIRDQTAMSELVEAVLGPLRTAKDGPERLVRTLQAYFACGANTAAAARELHLSVRATTYRLDRVGQLTGYRPTEPADHLPLHVAVTGARLLKWPHQLLVRE